MLWITRSGQDAHRGDGSTPSREGPWKPLQRALTKNPARTGSRGVRGAGRGEVLGDAGGRTHHGRKTRSACNSEGHCSFSIQYLYETTTRLSFPPTAKIAGGGAWWGESHVVLWDRGQSQSPRGGMKRGMNGALGENGNSRLAPRPALLRGVPCSR